MRIRVCKPTADLSLYFNVRHYNVNVKIVVKFKKKSNKLLTALKRVTPI